MYRMHQNVRYAGGVTFSFHVTVSVALQGFCTALGYRSIQRVVNEGKQTISNHISSNQRQDRHATASECLATFVLVSICLYCPLSFIVLAFSVETSFGVVEPVTSLLIVVIGNSSGWANAAGYFRNRRIKQRWENQQRLVETNSNLAKSSNPSILTKSKTESNLTKNSNSSSLTKSSNDSSITRISNVSSLTESGDALSLSHSSSAKCQSQGVL